MDEELKKRLDNIRKSFAQAEIDKYGRELTAEERDEAYKKEEDARKEEEKREKIYEEISRFKRDLPLRFENATFGSFQCSSEKQKAVVEFLMQGRSAVIFGSNGTGKTHLAYAACRYQIALGKTAEYIMAFDFFNKIRKSFGTGDTERVLRYYISFDYLVIDEIDKTQGTPTEFMYLYALINSRYNEMRSTVLITNASPGEFGAIIGQSALDRVASEGKVIELTGDNYRQKK
ncbi:MAG: ATP-binding protein [Clostridia bacterium]|nr:ATP-binding protein [Clostridia bacterium]